MDSDTTPPTSGLTLSELREKIQTLYENPEASIDRLIGEQNLNIDCISRINDVALRGARSLIIRQGAALRESCDELNAILKQASKTKSGHPLPAASLLCLEASFNRGFDHLKIAFDWAAEVNAATLEILQGRFSAALQDAKAEAAASEAATSKTGKINTPAKR